MTISAMVFDGPGRPLRLISRPRPELSVGEALVRVSLCTLCGSDLHTYSGRRNEPTPTVLGHEIVGTIDELGLGEPLTTVDDFELKLGDRVVWSVAVSCRHCFNCTHNLPQKCERLRKYGHEVLTPENAPMGGLTTHCHLLANTAIVKVPEDLPDAVAAPAMCATATVAAALRAGDVVEAESKVVLILGAGLLGLTAACFAIARGSIPILADVDASRLAIAETFGIRNRVHPDHAIELTKSLTSGRGADVVIEMSGNSAAVELALRSTRIGGTVVLVGSVLPGPSVAFVPNDLVRKCLRIVGVHNYAPQDLLEAIRFLAANRRRFGFECLQGPSLSLEDAAAAFEFAERERPVRVSVRPNLPSR